MPICQIGLEKTQTRIKRQDNIHYIFEDYILIGNNRTVKMNAPRLLASGTVGPVGQAFIEVVVLRASCAQRGIDPGRRISKNSA